MLKKYVNMKLIVMKFSMQGKDIFQKRSSV